MIDAHSSLGVRNLRFAYSKDATPLYDGLSWDFRRGALTAITGESGRGKSTLLYVLALMLTPTSGVVNVNGQRASTLGDRAKSRLRAGHIGFIFQDAALDTTRSVRANVLEPHLYGSSPNRRELRERASSLLDDLGVSDTASRRPGAISGGQAQRVAVCRALVKDPTIILADEPTGNLDAANTHYVLSILQREAAAGRTVVVATHDARIFAAADETLAL